MKALTVIPVALLNPSKLNQYQYTLSLLTEASETGIIAADQVEKTQMELMEMLSIAIPKYTRHESNSVPTETAQNIMQSILYNIDNCLRSMPTPEQALKMLNKSSLSDCFYGGVSITKDLFQQARELWQKVQDNMLSVSMKAYNETIDTGFDEFFHRYEPNYNAHNADISIDYPLLFDDPKWTGVIYVKNYLQALMLENELCGQFSSDDLNCLLNCCAEKYNLPSADLVTNIADLVLKNSLARLLLNRTTASLSLTEYDCQRLTSELNDISAGQCLQLIEKALDTLLEELHSPGSDLRNYLHPYPSHLCQELLSAVKSNTLHNFLVVQHAPQPLDWIHYTPGKRLPDEDLRLIIEALGYFQNPHTKTDFITAKLNSIDDIIEVLGAYCFHNKEFYVLFDRLGYYELGLLTAHGAKFEQDNCEPDFSWRTQLQYYYQANPARYLKVKEIADKVIL